MCSMQLYYIYYILISFISIKANSINDVSVWGPGLHPQEIVMPARYFFINIASYDWNSTSKNDLKIMIEGYNNYHPCRIRTNLLNRKDGLYIYRYKLYETCKELTINIIYKANHIGESPYNFKNILAEECNCPIKMDSWLKNMECGAVPDRIIKDLREFPNVDWEQLRHEVLNNFNKPGSISFCHYIIKNNLLYRKCYSKYTGFKMFMDNMLMSLSRKVILPDVEFFVNLGDWPLTSIAAKYPIFSWCGSADSFDIIMPTYDISQSTLENLGRVTLDMLSVQGNVNRLWKDRIPKAFWRGRDSNQNRLKLIDISREHPDLYNASLTNFFFFRDKEEKYGKSDHISFFDFFDYKYQICVDGTVAAYRLPYLLGGGSLVLKQNSKYSEHFYDELLPNVHYVPIKSDLSDLTDKIKWAIANDELAYKIAREGQKFVADNLLPQNIFCYHAHLINEFSKIVSSSINVLDEMELVESDVDMHCDCNMARDEL